MRTTIPVALILAAALVGTASAAEGRIPLLALPGPPWVITAPGHYILTRNAGSTFSDSVRIESAGVTLDLGGHILTTGAGVAILINAPLSTREIVVRNGRILGGTYGVMTVGERNKLRFEQLDIIGVQSGIFVTAESVDIVDCHIHDLSPPAPALPAVSVDAYGGRVLDNLIENVTGSGLSLGGFGAGEIRRNVVRNFGAFVTSGSGILLTESSTPGRAGGAIVADNTVRSRPFGTDDAGITVLTFGNLIAGNVAVQNGTDGIFVSGPHNRLERNITSQNGGHGIGFVSGQLLPHLEGNQSQRNGGCGLNVNSVSGLVYRNNTFGDNDGGSICGGTGVNAGGNYCSLVVCP